MTSDPVDEGNEASDDTDDSITPSLDGIDSSDDSDEDSGPTISPSLDGLSSGSSSSSSGGGIGGYGGTTGKVSSWTTKLDFSVPYVLVAEDREGNIYSHQGNQSVLETNQDWRRLDEHPDKEFRVLYKASDQEAWLRFCHLAQDQLNVDPNEVLEDDPLELHFLKEKVHYPPGSKPDSSRICQVCGKSSDEEDVSMLEVDLQTHRSTPVCASHTMADLARNGLLE